MKTTIERDIFAHELIEQIHALSSHKDFYDFGIYKHQIWDGYHWQTVYHEIIDQTDSPFVNAVARVDMIAPRVTFFCEKFRALADQFIPDGQDLTTGIYVGHFSFDK